MDVDVADPLFAMLALLALAIAAVTLASALAPAMSTVRAALVPWMLPLGLAVAATATFGSLYYSEHAGYTPCEYCWYQRIAMYPLVVLFAVAWVTRDRAVWRYTLPLSLIGLGLSVYHYQLQLWPGQGSSCDAAAPCTFRWVEQFGFVSIPFMAGSGFVAIAALGVLSFTESRTHADPGGP